MTQTTPTVLGVVEGALDLIREPEHWIQKMGCHVDDDGNVTCRCAWYAVLEASYKLHGLDFHNREAVDYNDPTNIYVLHEDKAGELAEGAARSILRIFRNWKGFGYHSLMVWNDLEERTHEQVVSTFEMTIDILKDTRH